MVNFAEIRRRREALLMTLQEAADRAGFTGGRQQWYMVESGKRPNISADTLYAVAKALRCRMDDLMVQQQQAPDAAPPRLSANRKKAPGG